MSRTVSLRNSVCLFKSQRDPPIERWRSESRNLKFCRYCYQCRSSPSLVVLPWLLKVVPHNLTLFVGFPVIKETVANCYWNVLFFCVRQATKEVHQSDRPLSPLLPTSPNPMLFATRFTILNSFSSNSISCDVLSQNSTLKTAMLIWSLFLNFITDQRLG